MQRLTMKTYTGNSSWTAPGGVTAVIVGGRGGSGGGAAPGGGTQVTGGDGCFTAFTIVTVVPNTTYTITIGAGGAGAVSGTGFDGTSTTFGSAATFVYGCGGTIDARNAQTRSHGPVIGGGHYFNSAGRFTGSGPVGSVWSGQDSPYAAGGLNDGANQGGAGGDGPGGAAGNDGVSGGGGGAYNGVTVGDGTSGQLILIWTE